jgi:hypothetical protein
VTENTLHTDEYARGYRDGRVDEAGEYADQLEAAMRRAFAAGVAHANSVAAENLRVLTAVAERAALHADAQAKKTVWRDH